MAQGTSTAPQVHASTQNALEPFLILAKGAKGSAAVALIQQVTEAPSVYVFGDLLDLPNIQELSDGTNTKWWNLLNLFAYGTYADYKANTDNFPELSAAQVKKLKHLTVVSLAAKCKCIPYSTLLQELDMKNLRELEDLIIETVYADIIGGKLDQKNQQLEVDYAIGRDIRPEAIEEIVNTLQEWCNGCEQVLAGIETQISRANGYKEQQIKNKQQIEAEVANLKKTIKASQDVDQHMQADSQEPTHAPQEKPARKSSKVKGLRGSGGKFWQKSN
ncbi:COP9 signalosome complex subunit 7b-like [Branchiostoma floridae x Branchiostoma japonicum]